MKLEKLTKEKREQIIKWCSNEDNVISSYVGGIRDEDARITDEYGKIMLRLHKILLDDGYTNDTFDGPDRDWGYLDRLQQLTKGNKIEW